MIGRLVRSVDFERVLAAPSRARSAHFAVHHVHARPTSGRQPAIHVLSTELSTGAATTPGPSVDDPLQAQAHDGLWLGAVIPKRHAKRAVTRTLLKRQIRAAVQRRGEGLPAGLWVVRLRTPFDRSAYPSAASDALRRAAGAELDTLLADAARRIMQGRP